MAMTTRTSISRAVRMQNILNLPPSSAMTLIPHTDDEALTG